MRRVKYDNSQGIIAEYSFLRSDEMFDIVVRIDKKCKMILEKNDCFLTVLWYNNDINSPVLLEKVITPCICWDDRQNYEICVDEKIVTDFYVTNEYLDLLAKIKLKKVNIISQIIDDNIQIRFSTDAEKLFFPLDVLNIEVKFTLLFHGDRDDVEIDMETDENFIEIVG